jgi:tetratricopeptide (TPR) repeat protein
MRRRFYVGFIHVAALSFVMHLAAQPNADPIRSARSLAENGKFAEAEGLLRDYLKSEPSSADGHFLLGYVLFREHKARESLAEFTEGARFRRPSADEFRIVASDYVLLGDYIDAVKWFTELTAEKPDDPLGWYLLGRAYYNENRFNESIDNLQHALKLRSDYIEAENNLGLAWQGLNNLERATEAFKAAIDWQLDHPHDAQPYLNLGSLLIREGKVSEAVPLLELAAGLATNNPRIHEELSHAYEILNDLPRARQQLEEAVRLAPDVSGLHFKLGRIYRRQGLRDLAQEQFDICEKLDNTHSSSDTPNPYSPE